MTIVIVYEGISRLMYNSRAYVRSDIVPAVEYSCGRGVI